MKKAFTLIEILVVVIIFAIIVLIITAVTPSSKRNTPKQPTVPANFTVLSREATGATCCEPFIIIVKDLQTEQEYIIIEDGSAVSITPRLPKKEER